MALYPYTKMSQEVLQPGARGEFFKNTGIPGHRTDEDRVNRTNNQIEISRHDTLNIKYGFDPRLPVLFRYGWNYGYNQLVIPKGRLVACDPDLEVLDTDTLHYHNALTLANGGVNVELDSDGKNWKKTTDTIVVDEATGLYKKQSGDDGSKIYRPANKVLGIMERNEYTRDINSFNGIMPSPIRTDALIVLPWFAEEEKAKLNPWGSVYGKLKPGDLVKSDTNGRICKSPLSDLDTFFGSTPDQAKMKEYEKERQQVIGEVYSTDKSLIPEGAARFAQWALDDRKKFADFNPYTYPTTGRRGEDFVTNVPTKYQSDFTYPGYPYDRNIFNNDLHMLASSRKNVSPRIDEAHRLDRGIPGLTDGYNAVELAYGSSKGETDTTLSGNATLRLTSINETTNESESEVLIHLPDTNLEKIKIAVGSDNVIVEKATAPGTAIGSKYEITYVDLHKGLIGIRQKAAGTNQVVEVTLAYVKRGLSGVPTNLDWDGCIGTINILLQK